MEKFMFLFRGSDVYQPGQPPEAVENLKLKLIHWVGELSIKGVHVSSEPLEPTGKQVNGKKKTVTDTPFGVVKEIIGGCTLYRPKIFMKPLKLQKAGLF